MNLTATEQELLLPEIRTFAAALHDEAARNRYHELHDAVEDGEVGDDLIGHLGNVLEIGLQTGRLRRFYGADGESEMAKVFRRTPAGRSLNAQAIAVTEALSALHGQTIAEVKISAVGPGSYSLSFDTDRCSITVRLDRSGVRVENVAVGI